MIEMRDSGDVALSAHCDCHRNRPANPMKAIEPTCASLDDRGRVLIAEQQARRAASRPIYHEPALQTTHRATTKANRRGIFMKPPETPSTTIMG